MRTVIMADRNTTIDRTTLNGSGRLPGWTAQVGSKETAPAWAWKLGPKLKSAGGGTGTTLRKVRRPAIPLKFCVKGGLFQLAATVFIDHCQPRFSVLREPK